MLFFIALRDAAVSYWSMHESSGDRPDAAGREFVVERSIRVRHWFRSPAFPVALHRKNMKENLGGTRTGSQ